MIRVGILGDIGSGKSHVAKQFGFPVFNANPEVSDLYKKNKKIFLKLNKVLPDHIHSFPINKDEILNAILGNSNNLKKIIKIVHKEIRKKMISFLKRNKNKKIIILDIPLLLENNISRKRDVLIFVESKKSEIYKRLKKRKNFNLKLLNKFKKIQLSLDYKKKKSHFIIRNDFSNKTIKKSIKDILNRI